MRTTWLLTLCCTAVLTASCNKAPEKQTAASPAASSATTAAPTNAPIGKLPDLAHPTAYRLELTLDPRQDSFGGEVEIDVTLNRASDVIWLHGKDLSVERVSSRQGDDTAIAGDYQQLLDSGVAEIRFSQQLPAGKHTLEIHYRADFDRNLAGLFKVEEQGEAYALAKSESIQARRFLPGFDEPGLKATYDLRLTVPAGYQVITNSPETGRTAAADGMETVSFATTRPMPTYLLSLAVGPFDVVERPALPANQYRERAIPLRGFARKGRGKDMNYILDITPRMMEIFETELQSGYPFSKLDIVAAPQWPSGATELSAAITYREQRILVGDDPAPGARLSLINVHAHEIAHMWFGNLVTPPWWDDLWLKEGFATWGTPLALTIMEPDGGHDVSAAGSAIAAMRLDSLASTRAIREPINDNNNIRNAYDAITYRKSLGVIHMVDQYFGSDVFRPALGRYVASYQDGAADSPQFYQVIAKETDTPEVAETFRSFVEQKGVPLVNVQLHCTSEYNNITLQQQRYRPLGSPIPETNQSWTIPTCLRLATGAKQCHMLKEKVQEIELEGDCPRWVLPNASGAGYYRFDLETNMWQALIEDFEKLTPVEALAVIDSAFASFEAGKLQATTLWQTIEASSRSKQRQVVRAPLRQLQRYSEQYFTAQQREALVTRSLELYQPLLDKLAHSTDQEEQLLHSQLLEFMATGARVPSARAELLAQALAFTGFKRERDEDALSSDLYEAALIVAVEEKGGDFVQHLMKMRDQLDDPLFESASANALGHTTDPDLLPLIHTLTLSDKLGSREAFGLILESTHNKEVAAENWTWLVDNFPKVMKKIPAQWRRRSPAFAGGFCSQSGLDSLRQLFDTHGELAPGHQRSLDQTAEKISLCMALKEQGKSLGELL